jgi:hypothetical protein
MLGRMLLITRQTTDDALEASRLRVQACIDTYKENPCKRTHDMWVQAQNVASDMMLLHLRITNLQHQKISEESDVVCDEDILEETCVL